MFKSANKLLFGKCEVVHKLFLFPRKPQET
jgi:hypothetical protein